MPPMEQPPDYPTRAARADRLLAHIRTKRTCADCDLCCTAMGVEEIEKKPACRCPHLGAQPGKSCTVYETRPITCREFLCLWRGSDTLLPDNLKPSRVGFVIGLTNDFRSRPLLFTVHPDPAHPDSWKQPRHRETFKRLAATFNAIVVVGQHHLASYVFAPNGNEYSREKHPHLFKDGGGRVGLPESDFRPGWLTLEEVCALLWAL
jgi:uncharacterized protein